MSTEQPTLDPRLAAALRTELVRTVEETRATGTLVALPSAARRRSTGTRLALVAASVAALAVGASVLTPGQSAYAGWSATPRVIDGEPAQAALSECSAGFADHYDDGVGPTTDEPAWSGGLVEQRGRWQLTLIRGGDGTVGMCMNTLPDDGSGVRDLHLPQVPAPGSVVVLQNNGLFDHVSRNPLAVDGWFGEPQMDGHHVVSGVAGEDVRGVVLHTVDGDVAASLADGLWAAWWPAAYPSKDAPAHTGPTGATLVLDDGTTVELDAAQLEELRDLRS